MLRKRTRDCIDDNAPTDAVYAIADFMKPNDTPLPMTLLSYETAQPRGQLDEHKPGTIEQIAESTLQMELKGCIHRRVKACGDNSMNTVDVTMTLGFVGRL